MKNNIHRLAAAEFQKVRRDKDSPRPRLRMAPAILESTDCGDFFLPAMKEILAYISCKIRRWLSPDIVDPGEQTKRRIDRVEHQSVPRAQRPRRVDFDVV